MAGIRRIQVVGCSLAIVALMLASCGADDPARVETPTTTAPAGAATTIPSDEQPVTTPALDPVQAIDIEPCDLLTATEVERATGSTVVDVVDLPPISCSFDLGPETGVSIFVSVEDGQGRILGAAAVFDTYRGLLGDGEAEEIAGLGVEALFAPAVRGLAVNAGLGRFVALGVNGSFAALADPREALVELAGLVVNRLPVE